MAILRLRPFVRFSRCTILGPGVRWGYSEFSTAALHQLQHPAPASTSNRFIPRFLNPSIYWRGPKSISKGKVLQAPKPWNPATFYIVIFLCIGSQAIHTITLKHEHDDYMRRANVKIAVLKEVIDKLYKGENVDVEGMLGVGDEREERSWEEVLREIEEEDAIWQAKSRGQSAEGSVSVHSEDEEVSEQQRTRETQQPRTARDYGS